MESLQLWPQTQDHDLHDVCPTSGFATKKTELTRAIST